MKKVLIWLSSIFFLLGSVCFFVSNFMEDK